MRSLLKKIVKTINQATKLEWMIQRSATNGKKTWETIQLRDGEFLGIKWHDLSLKEGVRYM